MQRFQRPYLIDTVAPAEVESAGFNIAGGFWNVGMNNRLH